MFATCKECGADVPFPVLAVSPREAGRMVGLSHDTIRNLIKSGHLPTIDVHGVRRQAVPVAALEVWVEQALADHAAEGDRLERSADGLRVVAS